MNETPALIIISLLALMLLILLRHGFILARIARSLEQPSIKSNRAPTVETAGRTPQSDFDRFLVEDPSRQQLAKKEQAAAYRAWRKQNGLTWNA